jgi:hypothetical protein
MPGWGKLFTVFQKACIMKPGDVILRNQNPIAVKHMIGSALSTLAVNGTMLSILVLLLLATVISAADICRAVSGNHGLFNSVGLFAQHNPVYKWDPIVEKKRYRLERSDLDAYRLESRRWHQLRAEVQDRLNSRHLKKPLGSQSKL